VPEPRLRRDDARVRVEVDLLAVDRRRGSAVTGDVDWAIIEFRGTLPIDVGLGSIGFRAAMLPGLAGEITRHLRSFDEFL
jgi:hypothetical protein